VLVLAAVRLEREPLLKERERSFAAKTQSVACS